MSSGAFKDASSTTDLYIAVAGPDEVISFVQREELEEANVAKHERICVLGKGKLTIADDTEHSNHFFYIVEGKRNEVSHMLCAESVVEVPKNSSVKIMRRRSGHAELRLHKIDRGQKRREYNNNYRKFKIELKKTLLQAALTVLTEGKTSTYIKMDLMASDAAAKQFWNFLLMHMKQAYKLDSTSLLHNYDGETWDEYQKRIDDHLINKTTWVGFEQEAEDFWTQHHVRFQKSNVVQCTGLRR
jgi:hypothetical protein